MNTVAVRAHDATWLKRSLPWAGWILSAASMSILLMSARWKLTFDPWYVQEWGRIGWATDALPRIALIQLTCVALYLFPPTAVLGAVPTHRVSRWGHLAVHPDRRTVPSPCPTDDGPGRLGGTLLTGGTPLVAAPVP